MVRLFAALPPPFEIAEGLIRRQSGLPGAAWRPLEALHITLRFFGEMQPTLADDLAGALCAIAMPPFDLNLEGAGTFGDGDHMRAVWAGVGESEPLRRLAAKCETAARRLGLKGEARAYRPHVTLAYLRTATPHDTANWVAQNAALRSPAWRVDRFGLYSSVVGPNGSRYDLERTYPLI